MSPALSKKRPRHTPSEPITLPTSCVRSGRRAVRSLRSFTEVTTDQNGAIAEAAVVKAAVELGISVARPILPKRYDLLLDLGSRIERVYQ